MTAMPWTAFPGGFRPEMSAQINLLYTQKVTHSRWFRTLSAAECHDFPLDATVSTLRSQLTLITAIVISRRQLFPLSR